MDVSVKLGPMTRQRVVQAALLAALAVAAIGYAELCAPHGGPSRVRQALTGCRAVRVAAEIALATGPDSAPCPSVDDLVAAHQISRQQSVDPWGIPYVVRCAEGEARAVSAGGDRVLGTADDIRDDLRPAEVDALERRHAR